MNKFICFALVFIAAFVSGNCGSYGNLGSYGNPSVSSASAYAAPSYSLGPGNYGAHAPSYAAHAPSYGAHAPSYGAHAPSYAHAKPSGPKYSVQPAYATELFPGQQNYKAYNSAPSYSQVALPVVPSVPVAKLYVPPHHAAYGGHSYGGAANYGASASY